MFLTSIKKIYGSLRSSDLWSLEAYYFGQNDYFASVETGYYQETNVYWNTWVFSSGLFIFSADANYVGVDIRKLTVAIEMPIF